MQTTRSAIVRLVPLVFLVGSCDEPAGHDLPVPPSAPGGGGRVHFAVGNQYYWEITRIGMGNFFQWNEGSSITSDTTLSGRTFYAFDTGALVAGSGDSVLTYSHDSISLLYRFNVQPGDTVPFYGTALRATFVDTALVLGDSQLVVTMYAPSSLSTGIISGQYASRFGLTRVQEEDSLYITTWTLRGARFGNTTYGYVP